MKSSGADGRPVGWRALKSRPILLTAALVALAALLGVDLIGGGRIRIGGLMVAVPALAAVFLGPLDVLMLSVLTVGVVVWASADNDILGTANFPVVLATAVLVGAGSVLAARIRARRERQLAKVRKVAEATQRALLRPLPDRLGRVTISSMYLAAEEEAAIGGGPLRRRGRRTKRHPRARRRRPGQGHGRCGGGGTAAQLVPPGGALRRAAGVAAGLPRRGPA
ncbi:hypothetical protein [Actinacidiphila yanglinensis]|uniref:hypothetical protein n=1 Tax=Actinacidiphila yanglinensis TaxID=310779 RepID=UPI0011B0384B|nr:hypothetical protein [Actinacidiphila yanglinensis]